MEQLELEGVADSILEAGGQLDAQVPKLAPLVNALLGPNAVDYAPIRLPGDAALIRVHDRWRIILRRRLSVERKAFAVAHELAEWWFKVKERYEGPDIEEAANFVAAAVISPRRSFREALRTIGSNWTELGRVFRATETHMALREAEVLSRPRAVVAPSLVRVRGPDGWVWPEAEQLRKWARSPRPGLTKVRLQDDPRRVVLDVDEVELG